MKVAFVGQKGIPCAQGGIERYAEELSASLVESGLSVTVYTRPYYTDPKLTEYRGVTLKSLRSINTKHLDALSHSLFSVLHALFVERVDVIHFLNIGPGFWAWVPRVLKPSVKVVGTFQSRDWTHEKWGKFARMSLKFGAWAQCKFAHETFAVSQEIKEYAREHANEDLSIITNGVNVPDSLPKQKRDELLGTFGLIPQSYIFSASRLIRHKGIHYLIDAFTRIKESAGDSDLKLVIAGDGFYTDGYVQELQKLAKNRKDILFLGAQSGETFQALFESAKVFVLPSEAEGLSLVLLEALGFGLPTVVSDIAPNMESITLSNGEGHAALYFENKNVSALADKLREAVSGDWTDMTQRAQEHVAVNYSWKTIAEQVSHVYRRAVHGTVDYEVGALQGSYTPSTSGGDTLQSRILKSDKN